MANLNKVLLLGNLTRDPELRYTPKGTAVADIALAINRTWLNERNEKQEETTYVDITLWGRQAELAQQYLTRGRGCFIEGRLQMDTWEDKQTGQKRSKLKVVAESLQFLPDSRGGAGGGSPSAAPRQTQGGNYMPPNGGGGNSYTTPPAGGNGGYQQGGNSRPPANNGGPAPSNFNEFGEDEDDNIPF